MSEEAILRLIALASERSADAAIAAAIEDGWLDPGTHIGSEAWEAAKMEVWQ